jgi:hypothetical protein
LFFRQLLFTWTIYFNPLFDDVYNTSLIQKNYCKSVRHQVSWPNGETIVVDVNRVNAQSITKLRFYIPQLTTMIGNIPLCFLCGTEYDLQSVEQTDMAPDYKGSSVDILGVIDINYDEPWQRSIAYHVRNSLKNSSTQTLDQKVRNQSRLLLLGHTESCDYGIDVDHDDISLVSASSMQSQSALHKTGIYRASSSRCPPKSLLDETSEEPIKMSESSAKIKRAALICNSLSSMTNEGRLHAEEREDGQVYRAVESEKRMNQNIMFQKLCIQDDAKDLTSMLGFLCNWGSPLETVFSSGTISRSSSSASLLETMEDVKL